MNWTQWRSRRRGVMAALALCVLLSAPRTSGLAAAGDVPPPDGAANQVVHSGFADQHKLQQLLAQMEQVAAAGPWPLLAGSINLAAGSSDPQVAILRRQLARLGDIPATVPYSDYFDSALETGVKAFQARHGLLVDGIVGAVSRRSLNQTPADRVARIKINLERLRSARFESRHILVNIPAFELLAMDGGRVALRSPVVVGRPSRPTPVMADRIVDLVLSPTWTPTPMIARRDILPRLWTDPGYVARHRIRVFDTWMADAREIDPFAVDWTQIAPERLTYRFRQDPGPSNSLGQIRFSMTNAAYIYLHDTPHRELFEKPRRAFSSGCVRVANARALALFTLDANLGWSQERLESVIATGETQTIKLANPVPIHLIYVTVWVDEQGIAQFRNDLYRQDAQLAADLDLNL